MLPQSGTVKGMNSMIIFTWQYRVDGKIDFANVFLNKEQTNKVCVHVYLTAMCKHAALVRSLSAN